MASTIRAVSILYLELLLSIKISHAVVRTGLFVVTWKVNHSFEGHEYPHTIRRYTEIRSTSDALESLS